MENLKIHLIQTQLFWEDISSNLEMFNQKLKGISDSDLIVLPEMFTTGFSMKAETLSEEMGGRTFLWMQEKAKELNAVITGSIIIKDNGFYYNRLIWMNPEGTFECYDKRHLFTLAKEDQTYSAGTKRLVVELKGWKICPLICYDLRFPVWSRNTEDFDILLYTANFPAKRRYAWRQLLRARSIENQCYTLGINVVGKDGNDFEYSGDTSIIDPYGKLLKEITDKEGIVFMDLEYETISKIRKQIPFLNDRDSFRIDK